MIDHNICLLAGDPTVQTAVHTWMAHWQSSNPFLCTAAVGDPALPSGTCNGLEILQQIFQANL